MDVFISWSGKRSQHVADALRRYLPQMINAVEPWLSSMDIEAGARWGTDIANKLEKSTVGILCLTPGNLESTWLHFEAGALAKTLEDTFVCPYLFDLKPSDVKGPLAQFQALSADESGTRRLVETLNRALETPRKAEDLIEAFTMWWPKLSEALASIAKDGGTSQRRSERDMLEEVLELTRSQARRFSSEPPSQHVLPLALTPGRQLRKETIFRMVHEVLGEDAVCSIARLNDGGRILYVKATDRPGYTRISLANIGRKGLRSALEVVKNAAVPPTEEPHKPGSAS